MLDYNKDDKVLLWLKFIGAESNEERSKIAEGDDALMALNEGIDEYVNDLHTQEVFGKWAEEIAEEKGEEKKATEIAKNFCKLNYPLEDISKATGIPLEELKKLESEQ